MSVRIQAFIEFAMPLFMLACYQYSWAMDLLLSNTIKCYCNVAACNRTSTLIVITKFLTLQSGVYNLELHVEMDGQKVKDNCDYIPSCTKSQTCIICLGPKKYYLFVALGDEIYIHQFYSRFRKHEISKIFTEKMRNLNAWVVCQRCLRWLILKIEKMTLA